MIQYINKNSYKNDEGFTLVELVVVIGALATLASFAIPSVLNSIKISRAEEAKALMNGYAADCLGKYRVSTDPVKFINESVPDDLDNDRLNPLGYKIDGNKSKCSHVAIKPLNENENFLYPFDFRISSEGKVLKTATPSDNPSALNSCKGWAGKNCGLSEAQKAEFARLAAIAKAKSTCLSNYSSWLSKGSSGESVSWDKEKETCTKKVWAFEGTPVSSAAAVEAALKAKYGQACANWRLSKKNNKTYKSPNGNGETKNPECGGVTYWFHSGNEFTNKTDWTAYDNKVKKEACELDVSNAKKNKKGRYVIQPADGPIPCGNVYYFCNGEQMSTPEAYKETTCGAPPPPPPPPPAKKPPKKEVPGLKPGDPVVKCPETQPRKCASPKYRRLLPECECWR